jgi:hypothetical protein
MKKVMKGMLLAGVVAGLGACSGGGAGGSSMTDSTPLPAASDAFTQTVQAVAANSSDTALPIATDSYVPVAADSADPVAIN